MPKIEWHPTSDTYGTTYPRIMTYVPTKLVVVFNAHNEGTVLNPGDSEFSFGFHSDGWNEEEFTTAHGKLTLEF